jgi:hypothetical protein
VDELLEPRPAGTQPVRAFGPDLRFTAGAAVGALLLLAILLTTTDRAGRLLFGAAVVLLLGYVVSDLVFRPRLTLAPAGVRVRSPIARLDCTWAEVEAVHADTRSRYGLRAVTLEIDAGAQLVVLSRRALGADPELVAALAAGYRAG